MILKRMVVHSQAYQEIFEAVEVYNEQRRGRGNQFASAVREAFDRIRRQPKAAATYKKHFRKYVLGKYLYLIFYREFDHYIWIASVYHAKRRPDQWLSRNPD